MNEKQKSGKTKYEKRMFVFEYEGKTAYYTYDLLQKETVEWLKDVSHALHVGQVSKYNRSVYI